MASRLPPAFVPSLGVLVLALLMDSLFGEPPNVVHPVAWMGRTASFLMRCAPREGSGLQVAFGALVTLAVSTGFVLVTVCLHAKATHEPVMEITVGALLLKPMFALRALIAAAGQLGSVLASGDLERARARLRSLCSRDPSAMDAPKLVAGTVESLAENANDSFVAPLFYYVLLGLPGAVFYRAVNTLDAMIGYHGQYEYLGKVAARLDDALNLIPARATAVLLLVSGLSAGHDARRGWRTLRRDGRRTESPNAGRPIAAMAGLLGVRLEKEGHYTLGDPTARLDLSAIESAQRIVCGCCGLAAGLGAVAIGIRHVCRI